MERQRRTRPERVVPRSRKGPLGDHSEGPFPCYFPRSEAWGRQGRSCGSLFIDEGFGSLDEQTLDEVLDVLDSLRERDRSVGIVSHVADLRRRIPAQLEIVKERDGSAVRLRAAGLSG
ncbi:hypothetical protein GCM10009612_63550 [Streptomyces beijiangensis]|nr:hypothetical protein [Streptomyces beijiangensis]